MAAVLVVVASTALLVCPRPVAGSDSRDPVATTDDDLAVFRTVLASRLLRGKGAYLILRETMPTRDFSNLLRLGHTEGKGVPAAALISLRQRNERRILLPTFPSGRPLRFVPRRDVPATRAAFARAFPGTVGTCEFSLPGYTADRSTALVCVSHWEGPKSAGTFPILLRRETGHWRIIMILPGPAA
jgi:hypothetical protein